MRHLIVICHPKRRSFTHTVARAYADAVSELDHELVIRDLYRLKFDPVLRDGELLDAEQPAVPAMIRREQRHLARAGAVAFFYPLWWAFMPAMLKGYFDRVFSCGFAYDFEEDEMLPCLSGKKALVFSSSSADMSYLRRSKQWQAMRLLEKDHLLSLAGIDLLEHAHFPSITPDLPKRSLERHLERVRRSVEKHWGATPAACG